MHRILITLIAAGFTLQASPAQAGLGGWVSPFTLLILIVVAVIAYLIFRRRGS